ncbi:MAG: preprotein translocase subunit SecE [Candidatus Aureabacteria bacterium]|nr:preprotein translocase subunit SecE [Candidatus Auribacterota bacterium]
MFAKMKKFFIEVWVELKKVSWPTKKELFDSTMVVIVSVIILSIYIAAVDQISSLVIKLILKR